jgi:hypothetical protein
MFQNHETDTLMETIGLNCTYVGQHSARKEILVAYRAVRHVFATFAIMFVKQGDINAHSASVAVTKPIFSAYSTESAFITMIRLLLSIHP